MSEKEPFELSDEDYTNHLDEVKDWPKFTITNDPVSGRIPVTKIDSWKILPQLLEDPFFRQKENDFVFRGQRKYTWSLSPTLARVSGDGVVREHIAIQLLKDFQLKIRGRITDYSVLDDPNELWSIGQHHGLKTPLLDWSKSPFVALFFAFNEVDDPEEIELEWSKKSNQYRCIYVLDRRFVEDEEEMESVQIIEPRMDSHGRLVSQDGLFTISDYETTIEGEILEYVSKQDFFEFLDEVDQAEVMAKYICKIYIPNKDREGCLRFLRKMNIHHASLFPDLIGASEYSNYLIEEFAEREKNKPFYEQLYKANRSVRKMSDEVEVFRAKVNKTIDEAEELLKENASNSVVEKSEEKDVDGLAQLTNEIKSVFIKNDFDEESSILIAEDLASTIPKMLVTDWFKREAILAQLRNEIRITIRDYGIYLSPGDERIEKIVELLKSKKELRG